MCLKWTKRILLQRKFVLTLQKIKIGCVFLKKNILFSLSWYYLLFWTSSSKNEPQDLKFIDCYLTVIYSGLLLKYLYPSFPLNSYLDEQLKAKKRDFPNERMRSILILVPDSRTYLSQEDSDRLDYFFASLKLNVGGGLATE